MKIMRDYIGMFDVLKGFLLLIVVFIHNYFFINGGLRAFIPNTPGDRLCSWTALCMGLFFVITGYQYRSVKNLGGYVKKQFCRLILPYLGMIAAVACWRLAAYYLGGGGLRIQELSTLLVGGCYGMIQNMEVFGIWGYSVGALWFLPVFFFSGILFQLIQRISDRKAAALCIWGLTIAAIHLPDAYHFQLPWFLVQSCAVLGFMETGRLLKQHRVLYKKLPLWFLCAAVVLYIGCHIFSASNIASNVWKAGILDYAAGCAMSAVVLRAYVKSGIASWRCTAVLEYIGTYSMIFFLIHGAGLLIIPWEAPLGSRIMQLPCFAHSPVWLVGGVVYLFRCLGILLGCYGLNQLIKIGYRFMRKRGNENG